MEGSQDLALIVTVFSPQDATNLKKGRIMFTAFPIQKPLHVAVTQFSFAPDGSISASIAVGEMLDDGNFVPITEQPIYCQLQPNEAAEVEKLVKLEDGTTMRAAMSAAIIQHLRNTGRLKV